MISSDSLIYLAPLQGFTDFVFRQNHALVFGGIDKYFVPYVSFTGQDEIRNSQKRDVLPANNVGLPVVVQVLFTDVNEFLQLCKWLRELGYSEVNLNLGCPYPMVTNRGRGAAMLQKPEVLREVLKIAFAEFELRFSIKMRLGMNENTEIFSVLEIMNEFPLTEVIIHPRVARQMYKGEVNTDLFVQARRHCVHSVVYNGDILSETNIERVRQFVPEQNEWMIGRGILMNPMLPGELKGLSVDSKKERLELFHQKMFDSYAAILHGDSHLLQKMLGFWEYFSFSFPDSHKTYKRIKKASSLAKYEQAVKDNFDQYQFY